MEDSEHRDCRGLPLRLTAAAFVLALGVAQPLRAAQATTPVEVYGRLPSPIQHLEATVAFLRTNNPPD